MSAACHIEVGLSTTSINQPPERLSLADCGGAVIFEGVIRNHNEGRSVTSLDYEAYEVLAVSEMRRIAEDAAVRFGLGHIRVVHRIGSLKVGDTAVRIEALAHHRGEAFSGCRWLIDEIKRSVPIWKHEHYTDGTSAWTRCHHSSHGKVHHPASGSCHGAH